MSNLALSEKDKIVDDIIKRASDANAPMDERDRDASIKTLNEKLSELKESLKNIETSNSDLDHQKTDKEVKLDETDDEKAEIDKKIKRLEEQISSENIDREDKSNPVVRRLNSAIEERTALNDISESYQNDITKIEENKDKNESEKDAINDKIREIEQAKSDINSKLLSNKLEDAADKAIEKAERNTSHEKDPFLVLLESLFKRYQNVKERNRLIEDAQKKELENQDKTESRYAVSDNGGDSKINVNEDNQPEKDKNEDDICVSVIITDNKTNKTQVKILTPEEFVAFSNSEETKAVKDKIAKESELSDRDKTMTVVVSSHESKAELLKKLEPIMKSGIDNPQDIGQYATSATRRKNLIAAIFDDAKDSKKLGGDAQDEHLVTSTTMAQKDQPNLNVLKTVKGEEAEMKIEDTDIPWSHLQKFNLDKKMLSKEDIETLKNGGATDLITIQGKNKKGELVTQKFKLKLENDGDGNLTFRKMPVLRPGNVTSRKTIGDIEFTDKDKETLKKYGQLNHLVPFTGEDGRTRMLMVGLDKQTNTLFTSDPNKVSLPKFITEQCTKEELRKIRSGQPVHVENLKDNAGQKFNGWVVMSPHNNGKLLHLKHIDKDFIPQVRNNNYGERTDELKEDKDAKVMTKQTKSNDGEEQKVQTTHRKALDFSVDNNGDATEHSKTIKTTKHM